MEYWKKYYNDDDIVGGNDLQKNIGRTKSGISIKKEVWEKTLRDIEILLSLDPNTSEVLELCCGNGQIIGEIALKCKNATGVDYSEKLLDQLKSNYGKSVKTIHSNVLDSSFKDESFHVIIIYFALQHFTEKETVQLLQNAIGWLKKGGKIYLGDIPNEIKKWEYIDKPEYKIDYIQRVLDNRPMIGNWFNPDFFLAIGDFFNNENINVKIIKQPDYQINSVDRFDVLIQKY